jgi:predicted transcriptional regulator
MLGLQNKDSLFLPPALVVNAADEEFQGGQIADALRLLARARDRTDRVAHERVDRLSPWKGREGDAAVDDVCAALQLMDFAEQKVARVPHFSAPSREVGSPDGGERIPLRRPPIPAYDKPMAKAKKFELESAAPTLNEEDEETLAAIDEGIRDAKAGRTVPAEEVRKRLPKWITASSTRKGR